MCMLMGLRSWKHIDNERDFLMNVNEIAQRLLVTLIAGMQVMRLTGFLAPLLAILSSSEVYASDITMDCGGMLYKYEDNFFQSDAVKVRWDGRWKNWCDGDMEVIDNSATCISSTTELKSFEINYNNSLEPYPIFQEVEEYIRDVCVCKKGTVPGSNWCTWSRDIENANRTRSLLAMRGFSMKMESFYGEFCEKMQNGAVAELTQIVQSNPGAFFSRDRPVTVKKTVQRETKRVSSIDFVGLMTDSALETISEPFQRADYFQTRDCKIAED